METISIRIATPDDGLAVARLAALDSATVPDGRLLLGERDGRPVAVLALDGGQVIADPFLPSAEVVELLAIRAARLRGGRRHMLRRWRPEPSLPRRSAGVTASG